MQETHMDAIEHAQTMSSVNKNAECPRIAETIQHARRSTYIVYERWQGLNNPHIYDLSLNRT